MHFQFLVEDASGGVLVREVMKKVQESFEVTFDVKAFGGIGGFTPKNTVKETKTGKLLNDLATYLSGFNKSFVGYEATIFVVLDNDTRDPEKFRQELQTVAQRKNITVDHVFCIAIEEMEAWLLGDHGAIVAAYPDARISLLSSYTQDSICGTWEVLAGILYKGGISGFRKKFPRYPEIGKEKAAWASHIGSHMNLHANRSPSFQAFVFEMEQRLT